ncbi:hypothetical protein Hanom_Chr02g00167021 [Helianthus anomalus]
MYYERHNIRRKTNNKFYECLNKWFTPFHLSSLRHTKTTLDFFNYHLLLIRKISKERFKRIQ